MNQFVVPAEIGALRRANPRKPVSDVVTSPKTPSHSTAQTTRLHSSSPPIQRQPVTQITHTVQPEVTIPVHIAISGTRETGITFTLNFDGALRDLRLQLVSPPHNDAASAVKSYFYSPNGTLTEFDLHAYRIEKLPHLRTLAMRTFASRARDTAVTSVSMHVYDLETLYKELTNASATRMLVRDSALGIQLADAIADRRSAMKADNNTLSISRRRQADARLACNRADISEQTSLINQAIDHLTQAHTLNPREPNIAMRLSSVLIESVLTAVKHESIFLRKEKTAFGFLERLFTATHLMESLQSTPCGFSAQIKEVLDSLREKIKRHPALFHPSFQAFSTLVEIWFPSIGTQMKLPGRFIIAECLREHRIRGMLNLLIAAFQNLKEPDGNLANLDMAFQLSHMRGVNVLGVNVPIKGEWGRIASLSRQSTDIDILVYLEPDNGLRLSEGFFWVEVKESSRHRCIDDFLYSLDRRGKLTHQATRQRDWAETLAVRHECDLRRALILCGPHCEALSLNFQMREAGGMSAPIALCRTSQPSLVHSCQRFPDFKAFRWMAGPGGATRQIPNIMQAPRLSRRARSRHALLSSEKTFWTKH